MKPVYNISRWKPERNQPMADRLSDIEENNSRTEIELPYQRQCSFASKLHDAFT